MDRVIKFRGFDSHMHEWVYGGYYKDIRGKEYIVERMTIVAKIKSGTIGEFTGFTDIDGKEIFEGDIIRNTAYPDTVERVFMYEGCWSVGFYDDEANPLAWTLENAPFKVIGNIHDNPELLEGGKADD